MATIKSFEDIEAWQKARDLAKHIYELSLLNSFARDFGFKDQINRATGSVMDNIAEGFERGGTREFVQFLSYARGSVGEIRSQLYRGHDRRHLNDVEFDYALKMTLQLSKMITAFLSYLQKSGIKGSKFQ